MPHTKNAITHAQTQALIQEITEGINRESNLEQLLKLARNKKKAVAIIKSVMQGHTHPDSLLNFF